MTNRPMKWANISHFIFSMTGDNCPRISRWLVLMMPFVKTGNELPQIFTDLRMSDTLQWQEAVVIGEEHISIKQRQIFHAK